MSKAVLISIRPKWCEKIANGEKTIEVRKTRPKLETPLKCYIYCTNGETVRTPPRAYCKNIDGSIVYKQEIMNGKVIGEFVCDRVSTITYDGGWLACTTNAAFSPASCLSRSEIMDYIGPRGRAYGWHISNLKIYDTPRELGAFYRACDTKRSVCEACKLFCERKDLCYGDGTMQITRPPQSWGYVEELP